MPLENTEAQEGLVGLELLNHASIHLYLLGNGVLGSRDPWSSGQIRVELLSLTWLVGTYHLCGETLCITKWLKAVFGVWVSIPASSALY